MNRGNCILFISRSIGRLFIFFDFVFEFDWLIGRSGDWKIKKVWNQFRNLDLIKIKKLLKYPILLGLRNLYGPVKLKELGFIYEGVGRNKK